MRVNKVFYVVLSGFDSCKSKLHKPKMPQTAYLLGVQEKCPTNLFLDMLQRNTQRLSNNYIGSLHFNCTFSYTAGSHAKLNHTAWPLLT